VGAAENVIVEPLIEAVPMAVVVEYAQAIVYLFSHRLTKMIASSFITVVTV
jgi:hypothetical protein